jgi:hypothetical protein
VQGRASTTAGDPAEFPKLFARRREQTPSRLDLALEALARQLPR